MITEESGSDDIQDNKKKAKTKNNDTKNNMKQQEKVRITKV